MEKIAADIEVTKEYGIEELVMKCTMLGEEVGRKQAEIEQMQEQIDRLTEELNHARSLLFGRKTERRGSVGIDGQMEMEFNEAELIADASEDASEEGSAVVKHRSRRRGKKKADLSRLEKMVVEHDIPEDRLRELFPGGWSTLPDDTYTNVEYMPARYIAVEHHIKVYCGKKEDVIVRADHPHELLAGSIATPSLVAGIMNGKYVNGLPLYRMEQEFIRSDVPISRQNMAGWVIRISERYLSFLYDRLKESLLSHSVVHADETPVLVSKDGRNAGSKSYMWVYRSNVLDSRPAVIFEYQKTRKADHPVEFLEDFSGTLVTDGFEGYHKLEKIRAGDVSVAGCWVHHKRKYTDALKAMGKSGSGTQSGTLAGQAVAKIEEIFHIDNELNSLDSDSRHIRRQQELLPLVDGYFAWVRENRDKVTRNSKTGKAFTYSLNQEKYLREFLKSGEIPMDNNPAERAIRPFCIGKKNWVMCDTVSGAMNSAIIYSITETAKANGLKPYEYLKHILTEIPRHMDDKNLDFLDELLPWSESLPPECRTKNDK